MPISKTVFNAGASTEFPFTKYRTSYSEESKSIHDSYKRALAHYQEPISAPRGNRLKFYQLFHNWKYDTCLESSPTKIAMHPSYQEIIGMGKEALPFIFKELLKKPDYWFWALKAISSADPVPKSERGSIQKMRYRWLLWGKDNGFIR